MKFQYLLRQLIDINYVFIIFKLNIEFINLKIKFSKFDSFNLFIQYLYPILMKHILYSEFSLVFILVSLEDQVNSYI